MTTFVLPCGTSVLDNLAAGRGCRAARSVVGELEDWSERGRIHDAPPSAWGRAVEASVGDKLAHVKELDPAKISAESSSLAQHRYPPTGADRIVLLASDTAEGVLAALVNASITGGRVTYWTHAPIDGGQGQLVVETDMGPSVDIVRIRGLRPISTRDFTEAMVHVGRTLRWVTREDSQIVLMLTGGYKATVPYLVVLAEYMKALAPRLQAFCLHEGDRTAAAPPLIEILLRTVDLVADKAEIDTIEMGGVLETEPRLNDFAYRFDLISGKGDLTPLGYAIKAFLDG